MADKIETINGSVIQHGFHNDRIYLMHLHGNTSGTLIPKLDRMAKAHGYGKIFAKIPADQWKAFKLAGYTKEAVIPRLFNGQTDGLFIAKFISADRQQPQNQTGFDPTESVPVNLRQTDFPALNIDACTSADAAAMASIYRQAFESYAFPIHQAEYIQEMMRKNAVYYCVRIEKGIAALAAAEIDFASQFCEMTDFATQHEYRGRGLAQRLLGRLDHEAHTRGIKTAYTIARADSHGMNRVFQTNGYRYAGRLIKNTQIGGRIRSMTVWYKRLQ